MKRLLETFHQDEQGAVVVIVGALLALLLVFCVYAVDIGQLSVVRTQLQNAADAAALAGARVGGLTGGDTAAAQVEAIMASGTNRALVDVGDGGSNVMGDVVITDADVTFPQARRIHVVTHRTEETDDSFVSYFIRIFDPDKAGEMTARAAAEFFWVCGGKCLEPWAPPDRWFDADGNGEFNPDSISNPNEYYDPITTGYTDADLGQPITIILGNGNQEGFGQFWYYSIDFPPRNDGNPISGADQYRDWMCLGCLDSSFTVDPGDELVVEPGKQVGPNSDGLECIVGSDPTAQWDGATGTVVNSAFNVSPRIVKCALFDPRIGLADDGAGRKYVKVIKIMVLFVESTSNNNQQITGRFMRLSEPGGTVCANQNDPTFLYKTTLVE